MVLMNMMRMICDSPSIIKGNPCRDCPKLEELARVLDESLSDPDVKVIVFSEWIGMLEKVRAWAENEGVGFAWHTGGVPQTRRRAEILAFRNDPDCRLFLSTDSGGVGLNLQIASVVINCDLPWNPAKLEQRIARAWRKNQRRPVTVINLVAEHTIEHGMLGSLASKMDLARGVLDGDGRLDDIKLKSGRQALLSRLEQVMAPPARSVRSGVCDPAAAFAARARERIGGHLAHCEESWLPGSEAPVLLAIVRGPAERHRPLIEEIFRDTPWSGARPALQILEAAAWDALQSLAAAGMITIHARTTRALLSAEGQAPPPPLTPGQLARIASLRALAAKKHRAAKALLAEDLPEEAAALTRAAAQAEAEAAAIGNGQPEALA
jgi:hypothetical protein